MSKYKQFCCYYERSKLYYSKISKTQKFGVKILVTYGSHHANKFLKNKPIVFMAHSFL